MPRPGREQSPDVADSTHNDADDGFHEIQLSGKQLVFLFMATTIVAVLIFLCGVQVGRNVRSDRSADSADALATTSAAPASSPAQSAPAVSSGPPPSEAPPPAKDTDDNLSYAKRLQSASAPKEHVGSPSAAASKQSASAPQPATAAATPAAQPRRSAEGAQAGNWVVQVHALKDRSAAEGIAKRLVSKGYPAFVVDPDAGAPTIYRVQVGRYTDRREAEQVARKLEKDEQYKPIIHSVR